MLSEEQMGVKNDYQGFHTTPQLQSQTKQENEKRLFKYNEEKDEGVRNKGHYAVCSRDFSDE